MESFIGNFVKSTICFCAFIILTCTSSLSQAPLEPCEEEYLLAYHEAEIELTQCLSEAGQNLNECHGFYGYISFQHAQACYQDFHRTNQQCETIYDNRIESAESRRQECHGTSTSCEEIAVVIYDPNDYQGNPIFANGQTFTSAAEYIASLYPSAIQVPIPNGSGVLGSPLLFERLQEVAESLGCPVDAIYVIDHGGDTDDDGDIDQTLGENETILDGILLNDFCEWIDDVTNPGAKVILCGCKVGQNYDLCERINDLTDCTIYANDQNVVYPYTGPAISLDRIHIVCPYTPSPPGIE